MLVVAEGFVVGIELFEEFDCKVWLDLTDAALEAKLGEDTPSG